MPTGDPKTEDNRKALLKALAAIKGHKKFAKTGVPELDPVEEMHIKTDDAAQAIEAIKDLDKKRAQNSFSGQEKLPAYLETFEKKVKLHTKVQDLEKQINASRFMVMGDDLRAMRRTLRRLEFIDRNGVVQLKGRMACEITSCDEILMTEIFFRTSSLTWRQTTSSHSAPA
jgi:ATP-dependent RNA helicase DOB1